MRNLRQRQFRDKTAYVGGQDFRPQLRFSCSVASVLQRFVPPCFQVEFAFISEALRDFIHYFQAPSKFKNLIPSFRTSPYFSKSPHPLVIDNEVCPH